MIFDVATQSNFEFFLRNHLIGITLCLTKAIKKYYFKSRTEESGEKVEIIIAFFVLRMPPKIIQ